MEFLENYEVILAKLSSSCCYVLSFSFFFVVFIFCDVGQIGLVYKMPLDRLCIKDICLVVGGLRGHRGRNIRCYRRL